jgi:hypothetical protein
MNRVLFLYREDLIDRFNDLSIYDITTFDHFQNLYEYNIFLKQDHIFFIDDRTNLVKIMKARYFRTPVFTRVISKSDLYENILPAIINREVPEQF